MTEFFSDDADRLMFSPDAIAEMLGNREYAEAPAMGPGAESTAAPADWRDVISQRGYEFCVRWETGGKAYYNQIIKARPVWPGFASGITIGCGYDLGYHTLAQFRADWGTRIGKAAFDRLVKCIGFTTTAPDRPAKVVKAKALVASLKDIVVPWDVAIAQFDTSKMPHLVGQLYRALNNLDALHPHGRAALLSLAFNRGPGGFAAAGDRYVEMREIARLMDRQEFAKIPAQVRRMGRLWAGSSLETRRNEEADLFSDGLKEESIFFVAPAGVEAVAAAPLQEDHADVAEAVDQGPDEAPEDFDTEAPAFALEGPGPGLADVKWNPNDEDQPDYRHLPKPQQSGAFELTPADIEALIRLNDFALRPAAPQQPHLVVFALRGASIVGADKREGVAAVLLDDIRPDHRAYRCVMGVLNRDTGRMSVYKASTVPNASAVLGCFRLAQAGKDLTGNVLPTGCYTYTFGTHKAGQDGEIRGVLRLSQASTGASPVVVLRSRDDVMYDRRDFWDPCAPADNIHPGRRTTGFSSLGCLTLPGDYNKATRVHTGLWADFRVALGVGRTFAASDDGKQFSSVLLTGLDAAIAARLREAGQIDTPAVANAALRRLRFGSKGAAVADLQARLGLAPDASQLLGPVTRMALIKRQEQRLGWADGIWSDEMAAALF